MLSNTWITDNPLDFEYKQYLLLGYLQRVETKFSEYALYPELSELIDHFKNLHDFESKRNELQSKRPGVLNGIDWKNLQPQFEKKEKDSAQEKMVNELVRWSIPKIKNTIDQGSEIYEDINAKLEVEVVGLSPLFTNEGYMLLRFAQEKTIRIYRFASSPIKFEGFSALGLRMEYLFSELSHSIQNYVQLKRQLIKQFPQLPQPMVYSYLVNGKWPIFESVLPIVKRDLLRRCA